MPETLPAVTIGIPTYRRPDVLARALECVARQTYPALRVIVSDNATPGNDVQAVVAGFRSRIPGLVLHRHPDNIGPRPNFFFLLDRAETPYFMWLADDDEISDNYVEALVGLLEADASAVTAAGNWLWLRGEGVGDLMPPRDYRDDRRLFRLARFLWRADDAFFYGLHRTAALRAASFPGYVWPNRDSVMNWAYVYLLDMVLRGKILIHPDRSVRFINHDYTVKSYRAREPRLAGMLKVAARRINVHVLYIGKIARVAGIAHALLLWPVSVACLLRELATSASLRVKGRWHAFTGAAS